MSEAADLMATGVLCETCGEFIDAEAVGHPRRCEDCVVFDTELVLDDDLAARGARDESEGPNDE